MLRDDVQPISVDDHVIGRARVRGPHRTEVPGPPRRIVERDGGTRGGSGRTASTSCRSRANTATRKFRSDELGHGDDLFRRALRGHDPRCLRRARAHPRDGRGRLAELLFPTFPRFGGTQFLAADDKDLALAMVRAWNDWMLKRVVRGVPRALHPRDADPAVGRARSRRRDRALRTPRDPTRCCIRKPRIRSACRRSPPGHWWPIFEVCNTTGLPLSMHIGTSMSLIRPSPRPRPRSALRPVRHQLDERARRPHLQRHVQRPAELQGRAVQ